LSSAVQNCIDIELDGWPGVEKERVLLSNQALCPCSIYGIPQDGYLYSGIRLLYPLLLSPLSSIMEEE